MKTPTCRSCKGEGTITVDGPYISRPVTMTCDECNGTAYAGMSKEQVAWYRGTRKTLEALYKQLLKVEKVEKGFDYQRTKMLINSACQKLGIAMLTVEVDPAWLRVYKANADFIRTREEFKEYRRRLMQVPVAVAGRRIAA